jgi:hypothetical protein
MNYTDKKQLEAIYEAQLIFNRINAESHLLEEGFFDVGLEVLGVLVGLVVVACLVGFIEEQMCQTLSEE